MSAPVVASGSDLNVVANVNEEGAANANPEQPDAELSSLFDRLKQSSLSPDDLIGICDQLKSLYGAARDKDRAEQAKEDAEKQEKEEEEEEEEQIEGEGEDEDEDAPAKEVVPFEKHANAFKALFANEAFNSFLTHLEVQLDASNKTEQTIIALTRMVHRLQSLGSAADDATLRREIALLVRCGKELRQADELLTTVFDTLNNILRQGPERIFIDEFQGLELCLSSLIGPMQKNGDVIDSLCSLIRTVITAEEDEKKLVDMGFLVNLVETYAFHTGHAAAAGSINSVFINLSYEPGQLGEMFELGVFELMWKSMHETKFDGRVVQYLFDVFGSVFRHDSEQIGLLFVEKGGLEALRDIVKNSVKKFLPKKKEDIDVHSTPGGPAETNGQETNTETTTDATTDEETKDKKKDQKAEAEKEAEDPDDDIDDQKQQFVSDAIQIIRVLYYRVKADPTKLNESQLFATYEACICFLQYQLTREVADIDQGLVQDALGILQKSFIDKEPYQSLLRNTDGIQVLLQFLEKTQRTFAELLLCILWYSLMDNLRNSIDFVRYGGMELFCKLGKLYYKDSFLPMFISSAFEAICDVKLGAPKYITLERPNARANAALLRGFTWKLIHSCKAVPILLNFLKHKKGDNGTSAVGMALEQICRNSSSDDAASHEAEWDLLRELKCYAQEGETPLYGEELETKTQEIFYVASPEVFSTILKCNGGGGHSLAALLFLKRHDDDQTERILNLDGVNILAEIIENGKHERKGYAIGILVSMARYPAACPQISQPQVLQHVVAFARAEMRTMQPPAHAKAATTTEGDDDDDEEEEEEVDYSDLCRAASLLQNLGLQPNCKEAIIQSGGLVLLLDLLRFRPDQMDLMEHVTGALHSICNAHEVASASVRNSGALNDFLSFLQKHGEAASPALSEASRESTKKASTSTTGLLHILTLEHSSSRDFVLHNGLDIIAPLMPSYLSEDRATFLHNCCGILSNLGRIEELRSKVIASGLNLIPVLVEVVNKYSRNGPLVINAIDAIMKASIESPECRTTLVQLQFIETLTQVATFQLDFPDPHLLRIILLLITTTIGSDSERRRVAVQAGVIPVLQSIKQKFAGSGHDVLVIADVLLEALDKEPVVAPA